MTGKRMKKHILFVDDEQSLALLGADLLEDYGFQVTCAYHGRQALEVFTGQSGSFDLVVTDESMPEMSGIELAQQLFRISPQTPVVLCSGHMLTMQEEGIDRTNIINVLAKTDVCLKLPEFLDQLFADS